MLMRILLAIGSALLLGTNLYAQVPRISDEGGPKSVFLSLDCVGPDVVCSTSGVNATIDVDGSGNYAALSHTHGVADITDFASNELQILRLGLTGAAPSSNFGINFGTRTSATEIGPIFSDLTYTGAISAAASVQSRINYAGTAANPDIYGILGTATLGAGASGLQEVWGLRGQVALQNNTIVLGAGEFAILRGIQADVMNSGLSAGGSHTGGGFFSTGIYIPAFGNPSGTVSFNVQQGIFSEEEIEVIAGVGVGFNGTTLANATTRMFQNASSELEFRVLGTTNMRMTGTGWAIFNQTPQARPAAYTVTNGLTDRAYDANATTVAELADVLNTVINDLKGYGILQ